MKVQTDIIKVTFLGTGTSLGVPIIGCECDVCTSNNPKDKRLRSSVMVETQGQSILIDCGPDFRTQMLREKITRIDGILITHEHRDHIAGLDDIRAFNYLQNRAIPIYAEKQVLDAVKLEFSYAFSETRYKGAPKIDIKEVATEVFNIGDVQIMPIRVFHASMPILGFRIGDFAYITDSNKISEFEMQKLVGVKVMVLNALRYKPHFSHFTVDEAIEVINKISPDKAYLTHLSHFIGKIDETNKKLPDRINLAYDGLVVDI